MSNDNRKGSAAGGAFIALGTLGGTGIGLAVGQVTLGILGGFAVGTIAATLIWLRDRR